MIRYSTVRAAYLLTVLTAASCASPERTASDEAPARLSSAGATDQLTLTGIIQSAGLSAKEKDTFNLKADFQLLTASGAWFLEEAPDLLEQWGKCVTVTGKVKENWDEESKPWAYERSALIVDLVQELGFNECRSVSDSTAVRNQGSEKETLRGFIERSRRPAPDIGYDYALRLTTPYTIENHPVSGGDLEVESIPVIPSGFAMQADLENYLEKNIEVSVQGAVVPGYAESTVVQLSLVRPAMQL